MKRAFIYLTLLAIALSLGLINAYLWRLQNRTQEHIADLRERLQQRTEGTLLDILRIKNNRITARVLAQDHAAERLDDLDPNDVFSRCLDAHNIPAEQRPDLHTAYRQILTDIQEADNNAE